MNNRICSYCGTENKDDSSICKVCGAKIRTIENNDLPNTKNVNALPIISKIAAIFLSIVICIAVILTVILYSVQTALSEDNLRQFINEQNLYEVIDSAFRGDTLSEYIERELLKDYQGQISVSEKNMERLLDSSKAKDFLTDSILDYLDDIRSTSGTGNISSGSIIKLLKRLDTKISEAIGYTLTEKDYSDLEVLLDEIDLKQYSIENLRAEYPTDFTVAKYALSTLTLVILVLFDVLLLFAIVLLTYKRKSFLCCDLGSVFLLAGISSVMCKLIARSVLQGISKLRSGVFLTDYFLNDAFHVGLLLCCCGGILIIVSIIINTIQSKKSNSK